MSTIHDIAVAAQETEAQRRRVQAILDRRGCAAERDLLAKWPHLARLSSTALHWTQTALEAQLALPVGVQNGDLVDQLTRALEAHLQVKVIDDR